MLEYLAQKGEVYTDGRIFGYAPGASPRFAHVSARRGVRAKVGELPHPGG
jgi:hypothetical protein